MYLFRPGQQLIHGCRMALAEWHVQFEFALNLIKPALSLPDAKTIKGILFDNEPYESDNEYLDESDDDMQYKDIDYRRNDQSKAFSDLSELLETES